MKQMRSILGILTLFIFFISCTNSMKGDSKVQRDSNISILRFDQDLYTYIQSPSIDIADKLASTYPSLLQAFGQTTVNKSLEKDKVDFFETIRNYFTHPMLSQIYSDEIQKFKELSVCEQDLRMSNDLVKEFFGRELPQFAVHVSGFKENVIVLDNLISLSADKYMGHNYVGYSQFFSESERRQMEAEYMARDYLRAWIISDNIVKKDSHANLLSAMIEEGKVLYLLSNLLPKHNNEYLIGFTSEQLAWCENNKKEVWKETLKSNKLFSTDRLLISHYIDEGTTTIPTLSQAPSKIGSWIGWQIVSQYAEKSEASVKDILLSDAQTILKISKYNP